MNEKNIPLAYSQAILISHFSINFPMVYHGHRLVKWRIKKIVIGLGMGQVLPGIMPVCNLLQWSETFLHKRLFIIIIKNNSTSRSLVLFFLHSQTFFIVIILDSGVWLLGPLLLAMAIFFTRNETNNEQC